MHPQGAIHGGGWSESPLVSDSHKVQGQRARSIRFVRARLAFAFSLSDTVASPRTDSRTPTISANRLSNHQLRESARAERDVSMGVATFTENAAMHAPTFTPMLAPTVFAGSVQRSPAAEPLRASGPPDATPRVRHAAGDAAAGSDGPTPASHGAARPRSDGA